MTPLKITDDRQFSVDGPNILLLNPETGLHEVIATGEAADALATAYAKIERLEAAREASTAERWRLESASRWLKERRDLCLKGGMSLQSAHDDCLRTMMRAFQEIDLYLERVPKCSESWPWKK